MAGLIFYATFALTISLVCALFAKARTAIKRGRAQKRTANRGFLAAVVAGVVAGLPVL